MRIFKNPWPAPLQGEGVRPSWWFSRHSRPPSDPCRSPQDGTPSELVRCRCRCRALEPRCLGHGTEVHSCISTRSSRPIEMCLGGMPRSDMLLTCMRVAWSGKSHAHLGRDRNCRRAIPIILLRPTIHGLLQEHNILRTSNCASKLVRRTP